MSLLRPFLLLACLIAAILPALGAPQSIEPGQYARGNNSGTLTIKRGEQNRLLFEIESIGGNCHTCSVSGVIRKGVGHADSWAGDGSESKCSISLTSTPSGIVVQPADLDACRSYCGARAGFDGTYRTPPAACTDAGRQRARDRFLGLYRSRQYRQAASTLEALIGRCGEYMNWIEVDQVRNDLALSQHRSGDSSQCLTTLGATLAAEFKDEEALRNGGPTRYLPPCDYDNYVGLANSIWFNKALCVKAAASRKR